MTLMPLIDALTTICEKRLSEFKWDDLEADPLQNRTNADIIFLHGSFRKKFYMSIRKTHTKPFGIRDSEFGVRDSHVLTFSRSHVLTFETKGWSGQDSLAIDVQGRRYRLPT